MTGTLERYRVSTREMEVGLARTVYVTLFIKVYKGVYKYEEKGTERVY